MQTVMLNLLISTVMAFFLLRQTLATINLSATGSYFTVQLRTIQAAGVHTVVTVIGSSLIGVFGFILVLIFGAQVGGNSSLYGSLSTSNVTAITGNIGKGVVAGSGFISLIFLGAAGAVTLGIFLLVFEVIQHFKGGT